MRDGDYSHSIPGVPPNDSMTEVSSGDRDQMREGEEYVRAKGADGLSSSRTTVQALCCRIAAS